MRSSKKRSRSSQNRPRTLGNIINRVFDSSGPEGKVRGTPQQIIEKYQMLARDAQLSNDRVAAENFLQHAEHYTRMLAEATREMAAEQEARQLQYQQSGGQGQYGGQGGGQNGGQGGNQNGGQGGNQGGGQPRAERENRENRENRDTRDRGDRPDRGDRNDRVERRAEFTRDPGSVEQPSVVDVIDLEASDDSGLIETPESAPRSRTEAKPAKSVDTEPNTGSNAAASDSPSSAANKGPDEAVAESATRRPRGPRKPRGEGKPPGTPPKEAAE